ncbi:MAG: hypothetical protein U0625_09685 [Phycisphaerales bacterium]
MRATAVLLLAWLPLVLLHSEAVARLESATRTASTIKPVGHGVSEEQVEAAFSSVDDLAMGCCGLCGSFIAILLVVAPLTAGAMRVGAECAAGAERPGGLGAGFQRYGATLLVGFIATLVGGGVGAVVPTLALASVANDASAALGDPAARATIGVLLLLLLYVCLWLTARLTFAMIRVIDPARPRLAPVACVRWSWEATGGVAQWILVAMILAGVVGALALRVGCVVLLEALAPAEAGGLRTTLASSLVFSAAMFVIAPPVLAYTGAAYAVLAQRKESAPASGHEPATSIRKDAP